MRKKIIFIMLPCLLLFLLLAFSCINVSGAGSSMRFEEMTPDEVTTAWDYVDFKTLTELPYISGFCCFDVNEDGGYVLGFDGMDRNIIVVCDSGNTVISACSFSCDGAFNLEWEHNNIIIYLVRGGWAFWVSRDGACLDVKQVADIPENYDYWRSEINVNKQTAGGCVYSAESGIFDSPSVRWGTYTRLTKSLSDGTDIVLYDSTGVSTARWLGIILLLLAFVSFAVFLVWLKLCKRLRFDRT